MSGDHRSALRDRLVTGAKFLVGVALLGWLLSRADWSALLAHLATLEAPVLLAVAALTALEFATRFSMWNVLLRTVGERSMGTAATVDLSIKFVNHVIPSKAAGHAVAPAVLRHFAELEWSDAVGLAASNTALYALLYGAGSLLGLLVVGRALPAWLVLPLLGSVAVYLVAGVAVALAGFSETVPGTGPARRLAARLPVGEQVVGRALDALPSVAGPAREVFRRALAAPAVVGPYAVAWAITVAVAPAARIWLLLDAFGSGFEPLAVLPLVLLLAYSVTVLPLTPGGVGVAEVSAVAVLAALGVAVDPAVAAVLVDRFLGVYLPAVLGWLPMVNVDVRSLLAGDAAPSGDG